MSKLVFTERGFDDYLYWQTQYKKTLKRINALLKDIDRNDLREWENPNL